MIRKLTSLLAAAAVALATLAPADALARDRRGHGYYDRGHNSGYYDHRRRWRDRDDDAVAAGVVGLVLGLAIGSMAGQSQRYDRYDRRDGYYRRPPPRRCYDPCDRDAYYDQGYDPRYEDQRYDEGYDPYWERSQCTRRERQWDRYAQRYVTVDVPC
jgi:hypothetical protein